MTYHITVAQNSTRNISLYFENTSTGGPEVGLSHADFSPLWIILEGSAPVSIVLSSSAFTEVDSVNLPGIYTFIVSGLLTSTVGETLLYFSGQTNTSPLSVRVEVVPELQAVDLSSMSTSLDEIKGAGFTSQDSLSSFSPYVRTHLDAMEEQLVRVLGLSQENFKISGNVYDGTGNLTQSVITIYPSRDALILSQNAVATYTMLSSYDVSGRLTEYSVRKNA